MCLIYRSEIPNGRNRAQCLLKLRGHRGGVMDVAWSKYDTEIATASMDTSIRIWDAQKGVQLTMLLGHAGYLQKVDWCPVYDRIVSV